MREAENYDALFPSHLLQINHFCWQEKEEKLRKYKIPKRQNLEAANTLHESRRLIPFSYQTIDLYSHSC